MSVVRAAHIAVLLLVVGCDGPDPADGGMPDGAPPDGGLGREPCTAPAVSEYELLDLGHDRQDRLERVGDRVISAGPGRWLLWDAEHGGRLMAGGGDLLAARGDTFVVQNGALCVRSLADGTLLGRLDDATRPAGLAADGSYVWTATPTQLAVFDTDGDLRFDVAGDYTGAAIYAAPDALRVARGPAGLDRVERIDAMTGEATMGAPMPGEFLSWFRDGEHLVTHVGTTVWVYAPDGIQRGIHALSTIQGLGGYGEYLWTHDGMVSGFPLELYRIDGDGAAVETLTTEIDTRVLYSGGRLGLLTGAELEIVELDSAGLARTTHTLPRSDGARFAHGDTGWAVSGSAIWVRGNRTSPDVDVDLGLGILGRVAGIDGSDNGRVAIATTSGRIVVMDVNTRAVLQVIEMDSDHVELSADGARLAAIATAADLRANPDRTLNVFDVATGNLLATWPSTYERDAPDPYLMTFSFSPDGEHVALIEGTTMSLAWRFRRSVSNLAGEVLFEDTEPGVRIVFSPGGEYFAVSQATDHSGTTNVYRDGTLVTAVEGVGVAWMSGPELLTQWTVPIPGQDSERDTVTGRWSPDGTALGEADDLPWLGPKEGHARLTGQRVALHRVTPDLVYTPESQFFLYAWPSGDRIQWTNSQRDAVRYVGATAGGYVVLPSGRSVLALPP